jgi:Tol biopolymer transport system component
MYSTEIMTTNPYNKTGIGELWAVTVTDGRRRRVYKGDAVQPAWSPNGHRIAFWTVADDGQRDLFTIPASGGEPRAVTNDRAVDFSPVWAPDGNHLLFSSDRAGSPNLWRVAIDETTGEVDGAPEPLTTNSGWVADLTLSGKGDRVAFASMTMTSNIQRFEFDPVAGSITGVGTWVTSGSAFRRYLDVSPDNQRLVFSSGIGQEDLFLSDADGSKMRQLTNDAALDRRPTWSPDGRQIAFESTREGPYQIWIMNGDGSGLRQLTDDPTYRFNYHAWSPAGDRMFTTSTATWNSMIFDPRRPWRDQQPDRLPPASFIQFSSMSWSPDGRRLAGWSPEGIATYDLDLRRYEVLTRDRAIFPQWIGSNRLIYPRGSSLMILDLATNRPREILSTAPDVIRNIAVSRDGRLIFIARGADEADIWMAQLK